jgi:hypothetical protein
MRIETLLPLGKIDPGLRAPETPFDIRSVAASARLLEEIGYDGLVCEETKDDPFIVLALAAQATTRLTLATLYGFRFGLTARCPTASRIVVSDSLAARTERAFACVQAPASTAPPCTRSDAQTINLY